MFKEWTGEDILRGRCYADLGEYGEFTADTRIPLEIFSPWRIAARGTYTYYGEKQKEEIELYIELDDPLTEEEIESLSAGEIFVRGWRDFTF